jgi:hypothetical protein
MCTHKLDSLIVCFRNNITGAAMHVTNPSQRVETACAGAVHKVERQRRVKIRLSAVDSEVTAILDHCHFSQRTVTPPPCCCFGQRSSNAIPLPNAARKRDPVCVRRHKRGTALVARPSAICMSDAHN